MRVINFILSKNSDFINYNYLEYNNYLLKLNYKLINIIPYLSPIKNSLNTQKNKNIYLIKKILFPKQYNFLIYFLLRKYIKSFSPKFIICHDEQSIKLAKKATKNLKIKIIAIIHSSTYSNIAPTDYTIISFNYIRKFLLEKKQKPYSIHYIPAFLKTVTESANNSVLHQYPTNYINLGLIIDYNDNSTQIKIFLKIITEIIHKKNISLKIYIIEKSNNIKPLLALIKIYQLEQFIKILPKQYSYDRLFKKIKIFVNLSQQDTNNFLIIQSILNQNLIISVKCKFLAEQFHHLKNIFFIELTTYLEKTLLDSLHQILISSYEQQKLTLNALDSIEKIHRPSNIQQKLLSLLQQIE